MILARLPILLDMSEVRIVEQRSNTRNSNKALGGHRIYKDSKT
jgi:hypothetical protein